MSTVATAARIKSSASAVALEPIYKAIRTDLIGRNYLHVDETPVRVMDPEVRGKSALGWLWVYGRPKGGVLFDFRSSRGRAGGDEILKTFNGTIQSDGYALYGAMEWDRPGLKRLACWAHARQKFHNALSDDPIRTKATNRLRTWAN
ncbi:MAG: hypothetical protein EXS25_09780 [Pedosphaera sp.]|nr:hypothetical protein [Pedosphaera sp.]